MEGRCTNCRQLTSTCCADCRELYCGFCLEHKIDDVDNEYICGYCAHKPVYRTIKELQKEIKILKEQLCSDRVETAAALQKLLQAQAEKSKN